MTLEGLPLEDALKLAECDGYKPNVVFTAAPRRINDDGNPASRPEGEFIARVLKQDGNELICAWFYEPKID